MKQYFKKALVEKGKTVQEQLQEIERNKILESFEDDMEEYFEFLTTGLNIGEKPCRNTWSKDKEEITINEFIEITKEHIRLGFTEESASRIVNLFNETIWWLDGVVAPILQKQANTLDMKNNALKGLIDMYKKEIEQTIKVLEEYEHKINDYDNLKSEHEQTKKQFNELLDLYINEKNKNNNNNNHKGLFEKFELDETQNEEVIEEEEDVDEDDGDDDIFDPEPVPTPELSEEEKFKLKQMKVAQAMV